MTDETVRTTLEHARAVADAVLYEGYLLYPYRATSSKNQSRWQFGVLGPQGAAAAGSGEESAMSAQLLVRGLADGAQISVRLRFLQLQSRDPRQRTPDGTFEPVDELVVGERRWLRWDEAVEQEPEVRTWPLEQLHSPRTSAVDVPGGEDVERVREAEGAEAGRLVRTRCPLSAQLAIQAEAVEHGLVRVSVAVENVAVDAAGNPATAIAHSFIGAHLLVSVSGAEFVSMTDPPVEAAAAAESCRQHRCWPVLAGPEGDRTLMLVSPIILYDHPEVAPQSAGSLFDSTEIDEILTLRVMTMTDAEKASARATDAKAAEIIDRCDAMSPEAMQQLHGILRDPRAAELDVPTFSVPSDVDLSGTFGFDGDVPWWDPAVDGSVDPSTDAVLVKGVRVAKGSFVRIQPARRADAQDIFFAGQLARVTAVLNDVDGQHHVAVVLVDDPAAEMHDWYGRYLYFAPDEIEPVPAPAPAPSSDNGKETRS